MRLLVPRIKEFTRSEKVTGVSVYDDTPVTFLLS